MWGKLTPFTGQKILRKDKHWKKLLNKNVEKK